MVLPSSEGRAVSAISRARERGGSRGGQDTEENVAFLETSEQQLSSDPLLAKIYRECAELQRMLCVSTLSDFFLLPTAARCWITGSTGGAQTSQTEIYDSPACVDASFRDREQLLSWYEQIPSLRVGNI